MEGILNQHFDQVFVITLPRAKDRQENMTEQLGSKGIDFTFYYGVDKYKLNEFDLTELYDEEKARKENWDHRILRPGQIAFSLSHLFLYKHIVDNNIHNALILEDDLIVNALSLASFNQVMSELPSDWELLYLGHLGNNMSIPLSIKFRLNFAYPVYNRLIKERFDASATENYFARPYSDHLFRAGYHYGTQAYAVTTAGAKKLYDYNIPIFLEGDFAIANMIQKQLLNGFTVKDFVFEHDTSFESLIGKD